MSKSSTQTSECFARGTLTEDDRPATGGPTYVHAVYGTAWDEIPTAVDRSRLIQSAPSLLRVAQSLSLAFNHTVSKGPSVIDLDAILSQARKAIRLASPQSLDLWISDVPKQTPRTSHTPGPWRIDSMAFLANGAADNLGEIPYIVRGDDRVAVMDSNLPVGISLANARLIAAAPDLLEAAQYCLRWFGGAAIPGDWKTMGEVTVLLQAAIRKATGEEE